MQLRKVSSRPTVLTTIPYCRRSYILDEHSLDEHSHDEHILDKNILGDYGLERCLIHESHDLASVVQLILESRRLIKVIPICHQLHPSVI